MSQTMCWPAVTSHNSCHPICHFLTISYVIKISLIIDFIYYLIYSICQHTFTNSLQHGCHTIFICNKFVHYYYLLFNKFIYYYHLLLLCITLICQHAISTTGPSLRRDDCHLPLGACQPANGSVKPVKCRNFFGGSLASSKGRRGQRLQGSQGCVACFVQS